MKTFLILCGMWLAIACVSAQTAPATMGLTVDGEGRLLKEDKPYRAIGVNYFDAFLRTLHEPPDESYDAGFAALAAQKIPFVRFCAIGFWPCDLALYRTNAPAYFQRLDGVIRSAERHGVGLIPSLFWTPATVPDLVGEPCDQWGNAASQTQAFMRRYVREVVIRYHQSPAIWGWEFGNEYNLACDLPNAATHRPKVAPRLGTPTTRSAHDELITDILRVALVQFAAEVRRYDPLRFITSGHSMPRPAAWHMLHERSWRLDSPEQFAEVLEWQHPDPVNVVCIHAYLEALAAIPQAAKVAAHLKKPLFIGEFQLPDSLAPAAEQQFKDVLALIENSGVALAAVWDYDCVHADREWNVTPTNGRAYQLKAIAAANERLRAGEQR